MSKTVAIAGGGLAGLSAAVFLAERGFHIELYESSPKLGGRAYSFFDREREMFFDNGQHLLAGWYKNTFEYLKIIETFNLLKFQSNLEIDFVNSLKQNFKLKSSGFKPPFNLLSGLISFPGFSVKEKLSLLKLRVMIKGETTGIYSNTAELLESLDQTGNLMKYFWEPFIFAVFNTSAKNLSTEIFMNVMKIGFNEDMGFMLVIPESDLNQVFIDPAVKYLKRKDCGINLGVRIAEADFGTGDDQFLTEDGGVIRADYFISAVPFFEYPKIFDDADKNADLFRTSSIVSVHFFLKEDCDTSFLPQNKLGMTGLIGTRAQWVFKKSQKYFSIVISGADELGITGKTNDEIAEICLADLGKCFNDFSRGAVNDYKVIREKRATFIPDNESLNCRPAQATKLKNFFIAGDWTDTGLPSTIEGAILSAKICAQNILKAEEI